MLWPLLVLILLTLGFNYLALFYGFKNLTYRMEIGSETYEIGENIEITSVVENRKPLTVSHLIITEYLPQGLGKVRNEHTMFVMPWQRVRRTHSIPAQQRGLYAIQDVHLELGDFIGFSMDFLSLPVDRQFTVLPKKVDLTQSIIPLGSPQGDVSVRRWIMDDPLLPVGIRDYTGNEPQRFIHWPSSARHGRLMVKQFDYTTDNSVLILLNMEIAKPLWKSVDEGIIEEAVSLARAVMEEFESLQIPYAFASNAYDEFSDTKGNYFPTGLGQHHLDTLLRILGGISSRIPQFFEITLRNLAHSQDNHPTVVVITPKVLETYITPLNLLDRSVNRTVVLSVEEENLDALNSSIRVYRSR